MNLLAFAVSALHDLLAPFALCPALPDPEAGRHTRDYYEASAPPRDPQPKLAYPDQPGTSRARPGDHGTVPTFTQQSISQ